jgi:hypothetical protein
MLVFEDWAYCEDWFLRVIPHVESVRVQCAITLQRLVFPRLVKGSRRESECAPLARASEREIARTRARERRWKGAHIWMEGSSYMDGRELIY